VCSVCGKRILDNMISSRFGGPVDEDAPDAAVTIPDEDAASTPESRTRVQYDRHLWAFHPRTAEALGRPPLPTAQRYDGATRPV
jgi:hypothetical protein